MAKRYGAMVQFRTSLDQAGQIAGLAGELDASESEVVRVLITRAIEAGDVLRYVRRELLDQADADVAPTEEEISAHGDRHARAGMTRTP
jgi:hypothetical protein